MADEPCQKQLQNPVKGILETEKKAEVRSTAQGYELRVNGSWAPASREEVKELLDRGWLILWNRRDYRLSEHRDHRVTRLNAYDIDSLNRQGAYGIEYLN